MAALSLCTLPSIAVKAPTAAKSGLRRSVRAAGAKRACGAVRCELGSDSQSERRVQLALENARAQISAASFTAAAVLTTPLPAHADGVKDAADFLVAFWKFRTENVSNFLLLTVAPIAVPYIIFKILIDKKTVVQIEELSKGGWDAFMAERGLNINILTLPQLNAFVKAAEKGELDDAMVRDFVYQLELNEQWKSSTIAIEDPRAAKMNRRKRVKELLEKQAQAEASESKVDA